MRQHAGATSSAKFKRPVESLWYYFFLRPRARQEIDFWARVWGYQTLANPPRRVFQLTEKSKITFGNGGYASAPGSRPSCFRQFRGNQNFMLFLYVQPASGLIGVVSVGRLRLQQQSVRQNAVLFVARSGHKGNLFVGFRAALWREAARTT
jgi:hypothetical protein